MNRPPSAGLLAALTLASCLILSSTGCRVAKGVASLPNQAVQALSPRQQELQSTDFATLQTSLIRIGDHFLTRLPPQIQQLQTNNTPISRPEQLQLHLRFLNETLEITTQPNSLASLIELAAVSTIVRNDLESYWVPQLYGESAVPLLTCLQTLETNSWTLAQDYLLPDEVQTLQQSIQSWQSENVLTNQPSMLRFSSAILTRYLNHKKPAKSSSQGGLLGILQLDPLAGLDPATRELTQTRLFAERATYLLSRMPEVVALQTELLSYRLTQIPEVQQAIAQSGEISESASRLSHTAESLPALIQQERQAVVTAFEQQSTNLNSLAAQLEQTLTAGSHMASNLNQTLLTFNQVVATFENTNNPAPSTNSQPFRIQDYTETARELDAAAQHLTILLQTFDQTIASTNLSQLASTATSESQALIDHAFKRILQLALLLSILVLATTLAKRKLSRPKAKQAP